MSLLLLLFFICCYVFVVVPGLILYYTPLMFYDDLMVFLIGHDLMDGKDNACVGVFIVRSTSFVLISLKESFITM